MGNSINVTGAKSWAFAFSVLAIPFFLNDFGFIILNQTNGVYLVDYGTRVLVLAICFLWPLSRSIALEKLTPNWNTGIAILCVVLLPILGRLSHHLLEAPFIELTEMKGLFVFHILENPTFYWMDLTLGLFVVALTEELVFRKFAMRWLENAGRTPIQIMVISAIFFSLMHWGSGPGRLIYTFVGGLLYMAAYLRLRRLWPVIIAHWIENFLTFGPLDL